MREFPVRKADVEKNPFIGLFLKASDSLLLASPRVPRNTLRLAVDTMRVEPISIFVNQSPFVGLFSVLNSNGCVLPELAEKQEVAALKKKELNVCLLESGLCPGNVLLANDKACLASPLLSKEEAKLVGDCLGVEVFSQRVGLEAFASASVVTNNGVLAYNELSDVELKYLKKVFGVTAVIGTTNFGVPFNALSVVANSSGALIGELTTGFEAQRVFEALAGD